MLSVELIWYWNHQNKYRILNFQQKTILKVNWGTYVILLNLKKVCFISVYVENIQIN